MGMDWGQLLGTLGGAWLGSQNGAKQAGTTTVTQNPWGPMQPFLVGGQGNIPGIADQAANIYMGKAGGMPDYLQGAYTNALNTSNNASYSPVAQALQGNILNLLGGQPANLGMTGGVPVGANPPSGSIGSPTARTQSVAPSSGGAVSASSYSGGGNAGMPSTADAFKRLLSGEVDTDPYNKMYDAASGRLSDNFNNSVLPSINQGSTAAGQYGSSRAGIAQGLAAKGLSQSMSDLGANMYGNAYALGQQNMSTAANNILNNETSRIASRNSLAAANAGAAASRANAQDALAENARQFNSNYGLNALTTAGNVWSQMLGGQGSAALNAINAGTNANNYDWSQLGNYQNVIQPLAGMGNSQSTPYYTNPYLGALGGAQMGSQIGQNLGFGGSW